ncbi:MAG: NUDIX domain-containing protein [Bacilli bacterium]|nr:NUDIX domain-containing protein [Bacilli bacterium]
MKEYLLNVLNEYLLLFPDEQVRQKKLNEFLLGHTEEEFTDWNNFDGHIVASGFVYSIKDKKFLVLYHKDLKMYLYPGGHVDKSDSSILEAAKREVKEETGLTNFNLFSYAKNENIPIDIDTHVIGYNERLNLPEHYHFDFRYLFTVDEITDVNIDLEESSDYKWIDMNELKNDPNYGNISKKIERLLG